jgi:hypothetical protein
MRSFRIVTFSAVVLFAMSLAGQDVLNPDFNLPPGGPGGGDGCQTCSGDAYSAPYMSLRCSSPDSGDWGKQNCRLETVEGMGVYCFLDGYDCCVD